MTQINLLPWREQAKVVKNKIFLFFASTIVVVSALLILAIKMYISSGVEIEKANIRYIDHELSLIESQIKEIANLQIDKEKLLQRQKIVEILQDDRYSIIKLLHDISRAAPLDVIINNIKRTDKQVYISGLTNSNTSIANLVKNLEQYKWLQNIKLTKVELNKDRKLYFDINFTQGVMEE